MTEPAWPVLRQGGRGPNVTTLQYLLRGARDQWRTLAADGEFGPATDSVVRGFQSVAGLTVDGIAGPATWQRLTDGTTIGSTVREGDQGEVVKAAQTELLKHGDLKTAAQVDGVFGPDTDTATRRFQERVALTVDGIVGPATWRRLISTGS
ncbi:peptidoglycan-binding domain-containing protein [Actinoallomurus rhizosphaericola]|uniref:peptidoglycan-binding domain-containing protein n=1 Tax=Actinoallomurus rhizosphaericola TaxID=2952536 RepID=UPI002090CADC|nr:peptidoglycan-binding protein [Actinoallomurus rhizosphaericola]MCO5992049.1 peptidoglycan-binding protein [Actinoallomurus rhizosphaericola]